MKIVMTLFLPLVVCAGLAQAAPPPSPADAGPGQEGHDGVANDAMEQLARRGRYMVWAIARDSRYGVFVEDAVPLRALVRDAAGSADDVLVVTVRNAKGAVLASHGSMAGVPPRPTRQATVHSASTDHGEEVLVFGCPVMSPASSAGSSVDAMGDVQVALSLRHLDGREQLDRLGRFIAADLARDSEYGVAVQDEAQLAFLAEAVPLVGESVAVVIRNARGTILARRGSVDQLPSHATPEPMQREILTAQGQSATLFSAPVRHDGGLLGDVHVALRVSAQ